MFYGVYYFLVKDKLMWLDFMGSVTEGTQFAQSRYLFALVCFDIGLLRKAEATLCPLNEPSTEVIQWNLVHNYFVVNMWCSVSINLVIFGSISIRMLMNWKTWLPIANMVTSSQTWLPTQEWSEEWRFSRTHCQKHMEPLQPHPESESIFLFCKW